MTTAVLVHGAWHGAWVWDDVRHHLDRRGVAVATPDLPQDGCAHDVATLAKFLDEVADDRLVLCGHSYGCDLISHAAVGRTDLAALIYIAGFVPGATPRLPGRPTVGWDCGIRHDDGTVEVNPERAVEALYHDCPPGVAQAAIARLRPVLADATDYLGEPSDDLPIDRIYSVYAVCTDDRMVDADDQREVAVRADRVVEWPTSHSPMLSRPDLVADLVIDVVGKVARDSDDR